MKYQWKVIDHQITFQGYFRMELFHLQNELYDGGWSQVYTREIFERGSAVAVLPYDPVRDEVVLIEQFRPGAINFGSNPWLKECVAGIIEPGETDTDVAKRESIEEAGCEITNLELISKYFVSPGGTTEQCTLYCGLVDSTDVSGTHGLAEEQEDIRVETVDADTAFSWISEGSICSANAIIALQWLQLNRERLRKL